MAWQRKTWLRIGLAGVIFVALVLTLLPVVVRYVAIDQLAQRGAEQVQLADVDINLFTGRVGLTGLSAAYRNKPALAVDALSIDLSVTALFSKKALVESVRINGLYLRVDDDVDGRFLAGIPLPEPDGSEPAPEPDAEPAAEDGAAPWGIGVAALQWQDIRVDVSLQGVEQSLVITSLGLRELYSWRPELPSDVNLAASINERPLQVGGKLQPFTEEQRYAVQLTLDAFALKPLQPLVKAWVPVLDAALSLDLHVDASLAPDGGLQVTPRGFIAMDIADVQQGDIRLRDTAWRWDGDVQVHLVPASTGDGFDVAVTSDATLSNERLQLDFAPLNWQIHHQGLNIPYALSMTLPAAPADPDALPSVVGTVQFALQDLSVRELADEDTPPSESVLVASLAALDLTDVTLNTLDDLQVKRFSVQGVSLLQPNADTAASAVAGLTELALTDLALAGFSDLAIEQVALSGLQANVELGDAGLAVIDPFLKRVQTRLAREEDPNVSTDETAAADRSAVGPESGDATNPPETSETTTFQFRIGEISVTGDNPLRFRDATVDPAVLHQLHVTRVHLSAIDSRQPHNPSALEVVLQPDEHGELSLKGELTPLQYDHYADLALELRGLQLTPLTPYAEKAIGYALDSGQAGVSSTIKVDQGMLESQHQVRLQRLELEAVDPARIEKISRQITMPVPTALDLLKDADGQITLDVPVNGALDDPQVSLGQVIQMATTQAVKKGTMTYLKLALQPYGAIWMAAEYVGEKMSAFTLEPMRFEPRTAQILTGQTDYLPKLAEVLKGRSALTVRLCPVVTQADFLPPPPPPEATAGSPPPTSTQPVDAQPVASEVNPSPEALSGTDIVTPRTTLQPEDVALGRERVKTLKSLLVDQYGIAAEQILDCRPRYGEGEPRVLLEL